jgi:pyruvate dehydrogenase E1 component
MDMLLYYREETDGQILEEGITEAGSMASFTAAGSAYSNYGLPVIPFYMYYSMFGFQRVGDMIWAFADSRGKGFLMAGTAGRTTMLGEGLQHQDGHSHILMSTVPNCVSYDPAYVYELGVILQDGIRRMYQEGESVFYYITMYNEDYAMPGMPEGVRDGILRGIYKVKSAKQGIIVAQVFGSGPILNETLRAHEILAEQYDVQTDVWSVTSYTELRREALAVERWNRLHPADPEKTPYVVMALRDTNGPIVAASDYMKAVPDQLAPWLGDRLVTLGTDGFGRSDNREHLRRHFEVNAESIVAATLSKLARSGKFETARAQQAFVELGVNTEQGDPARR